MAELDVAIGVASGRSHDRMRAIRSLILRESRDTVRRIFEASERTLKRWIKSFNAAGIDGLLDKPRSGRPAKIDEDNAQVCRELVVHPDKAGQKHWTGKKFHGHLCEKLGLEIGYSTTIRWLHDNNFCLKVPQPWPDRQDEELRKAFVELIRKWMADHGIDLWYCDETGIEGDPRPRRTWFKKGEKARVTRNGDHLRINVIGMVCPRSGDFFALEMSHSDRECFQVFLDHANKDIQRTRRRNLLIVDNASWHKCKTLDWGAFEPVFLPPYSPDLNPIEKLWMVLKAEWFAGFHAKKIDDLLDRVDQALRWVIGRPLQNQSTCAIRTEL